jgi:hypothetical protein
MPYTVSRQSYYYNGQKAVEVVRGDGDYCGSDMLVAKYQKYGEGQTFDDPREAVAAAIVILHKWKEDGERHAGIAIVKVGGMGFEGEAESVHEAISWSAEEYEELPKCDWCGGILPKECWYYSEDPEMGKYCREFCVDEAVAEIERLNAEEEAPTPA